MFRRLSNSVTKVAVGLFALTAIMALPAGCAAKRCGPCSHQATAKKCPAGCTKPCCKKAEGKTDAPCKKPCCKKA